MTRPKPISDEERAALIEQLEREAQHFANQHNHSPRANIGLDWRDGSRGQAAHQLRADGLTIAALAEALRECLKREGAKGDLDFVRAALAAIDKGEVGNG